MDSDYRGWPHLMCSGFDCDKRALMSFDAVYSFLKRLPDVIGMQRIAQRIQEPAHSMGTNGNIQLGQLGGNLSQPLAGPHSASAHRVARGILLQQADQALQDVGRFFSARGRPAPFRRTRSR